VDINEKGKIIFVKPVPGISTVDWDVDFKAALHTVLVRKMRSILDSSRASLSQRKLPGKAG
jgi:ATP-dependent Lhr-like helicase